MSTACVATEQPNEVKMLWSWAVPTSIVINTTRRDCELGWPHGISAINWVYRSSEFINAMY